MIKRKSIGFTKYSWHSWLHAIQYNIEFIRMHRFVGDNDFFLVSFPRSGSTWLRIMLLHYFMQQDFHLVRDKEKGRLYMNGEPFNHFMPSVYKTRIQKLKLPSSIPRIVKSHYPYNHFYKKVIYLVRDPRDVLISYYYYLQRHNRIPRSYPLEKYVQQFPLTIDKIHRTSWADHVNGWMNTDVPILVLRYEDLHEQPVHVLHSIMDFINYPWKKECAEHAIEFSRFENLRQSESSGKSDQIRFIRKGIVGEHTSILTERQISMLNHLYKDLLVRFKYR